MNLGPNPPTRDEALTLCDRVPEATGTPQLCGNATFNAEAPIATAMACVAAKHQVYLVGTLGDTRACSASDPLCPADGRWQWNTALALSPRGELLAKYHKVNLFQEVQWNAGSKTSDNLASFETDFGVTFGLFICFDMLFTWPAQVLARSGIRDFAIPIWWVNQDTLVR